MHHCFCFNRKKEKADVDKMTENKSIGDLFKTEADYDRQLSVEQVIGLCHSLSKCWCLDLSIGKQKFLL